MSFLGIMPKVSQTKFYQIRIAKSKVIHVQIPVSKWEKTKKWKKISGLRKRGNKGITNRGKRNYRQGQPQGFQIGAKRFQILAEITNRGRDYKSVQNNKSMLTERFRVSSKMSFIKRNVWCSHKSKIMLKNLRNTTHNSFILEL